LFIDEQRTQNNPFVNRRSYLEQQLTNDYDGGHKYVGDNEPNYFPHNINIGAYSSKAETNKSYFGGV